MMSKRFVLCLLLTGILLLPPWTASADRGIIPVPPVPDYVYVEEPIQKAIILWNGYREALYLTTDIRARSNEEVGSKIELIEVLPLPSRPDVKMADEKTFNNLNRLLQEKKARMSIYGYGKTVSEEGGAGWGLGDEEEYQGVYLEFHSIVGLHNITVVRAENLESFIRWMSDYYIAIRGGNFTLPSWMRDRVKDYLSRGINYFVFDYVSVNIHLTSSVKPVVYFFDTDHLYYPMYISGGLRGTGEVRLFIITDQELPDSIITDDLGFSIDDKIPLRRSELKSINSTMYDFPFRKYLQLYVVTNYVYYDSKNLDLYVESQGPYSPPVYTLTDILLFLALFGAIFGTIYFIWKRHFYNK